MRLLFVSSPVSSLNSGRLGGVALNLKNITRTMVSRGHEVKIVAPTGSAIAGLPIQEIAGALQPLIPQPTYHDPVLMPEDAVVAHMWDYVREVEQDYDLIVDFGYEWLPFYLSPFLQRPVLHYVCISSWNAVMDRAINRVARLCPGTLGAHTQAQAKTYAVADSFRILSSGIDLEQYQFVPQSGKTLAWAGRISPEKGLEDAFAVAEITQLPLRVFGYLQDEKYWQSLQRDYPRARVEYGGFLPTEEFQQALGQCQALLMTHKWVEALGRVALEAFACGVPVIAYDRGGPQEIVETGQTGFLVTPDDVPDLATAVGKISDIDRAHCRSVADRRYSLTTYGDRLEQWFKDVLDFYQ
ncbi:glycosyltransferase [Synechocystis sp. PCC 7339]|uniref:glycosyltransferase n=1 Tax=unclassified Synechocystis TaxID=2640012 RepID=UPI001BAF2E98|nr:MULTISPECIES: glycosyltransferase [unclassified Synechocystis]QUS62148.1 glycosyltransferase [Synechocystis sp. PCC 7338]UAJ71331.1 glycosyltransferase [Synechocystis sp. PCC 7339]